MKFAKAWWMMSAMLTLIGSGKQQGFQSPDRATPPTRRLLHYATRVTDTNKWSSDWYGWLPNHTILFFRFDNDASLWRRNLVTGVEKKLDLNFIETVTLAPSPDGKWLLKAGIVSGVIYGMNGRREIDWDRSSASLGSNVYWTSDSHHWLELVWDMNQHIYRYALLHSLDQPDRAQRVAIPPTSLLQVLDNPGHIDPNASNLRFLSKDRLLLHSNLTRSTAQATQGADRVEIVTGRFDIDAKHAQHFVIRPPVGNSIVDVVFSPDSTHIAWLLKSSRASRMSIGISRLDGSALHDLGSLDEAPIEKGSGGALSRQYSLNWLPDGKQVSFRYKHALWTVPTN